MIRSAKYIDCTRIAEIIVNSSRYAYKNFIGEEELNNRIQIDERIDAVKSWIKKNDNYIHVYEDGKTKIVKGIIGINNCFDEDKKVAYELHILYVDPEFSRIGIGTKLLEYFENTSKELGKKELIVWVLEENKIGRNFYEKHGYKCDNTIKIYERLQRNEIRYCKKQLT